jgi:serine/threonine protein kinase/tetratricopeptide (TPR) repeat protein
VNKSLPTVKAIFDRAHEIASADERRAYVEHACAGHPELRQKVEALLRAHDEAGSFLAKPAVPLPGTGPYQADGGTASTGPYTPGNTPPGQSVADEAETVPPADAAPPGEGPGTRLGPYRLVEEIGHGGMGAVYLAEQEEPVRRKVALKIIKPGMDSAQVVGRFEAERQALALMDHLNIARVLDAGATPEGRPYFVMELVQGVPITRFCDDNRLTVRERLELFVPVCQAIQHAHQKGVIHRDIKPSNVLVTLHEGRPFPKVIDFGIAKAIEQPLTEHSPETQAGMIVGTLEYMSPEQADPIAKGIDTRSDVYSLGVVLYELLTGTTPIERSRLRKTPLLEVLRMIAEDEPPRPSARVAGPGKQQVEIADRRRTEPAKLARQLRGDLDWIAAKALEKDPERRYETAVGLARDVQRHLADEPVEACPPSAGYRLRKFVRKHRALVASVAGFVAMLLVMVAGLTAAFLTATRASHERGMALKETRVALDTTDVVLEAGIHSRSPLGGAQATRVRKVLQDYQRSGRESGGSQEARAVVALTQLRMALIAMLINERADAVAGYQRAIRLYEGLAADFPGVTEYRRGLAESHYNLGLVLADLNKPAEAEAAFRRAADLHEKLAADFPDEPLYRSDLADDLNDLGVVLSDHRPRAAEEVYRRAIELRKRLIADFPDSVLYQAHLGAGCGNLANVVRDQGQPEAALPWYGEAIELLGPIVARRQMDTAQRFLRNAHWDRANALGRLGRQAEAIKDWQRAFDLDDGSDQKRIRLFQEAARAEEQLKAIPAGPGEAAASGRFYAAAQLFASASAAAARDEKNLSIHYAGRALKLLEQTRAAGFFRDPQRIEELKKDRYLKALGQQPDFQKFVAGLEAGTGPK